MIGTHFPVCTSGASTGPLLAFTPLHHTLLPILPPLHPFLQADNSFSATPGLPQNANLIPLPPLKLSVLYLAMEVMLQEEDHLTYGPTGILLKMKGGAINNYTKVIDIKQDV